VTTQSEKTTVAGSVVGFLVFLELTSGFVQGYYTPLLPKLAGILGVTDADIIWFTTLQTLSAAVLVPLFAKLGDMYGHRRILRMGIVTVAVGCMIIAFVPSYPLVLAARVLHGMLALWLPLEIAIIHSRATGAPAQRAVGFLIASLTGGVIVGTAVAGAVATHVSTLWIVLFVPVIAMLVALYAVFFRVPETTVRSEPRIDWLGFLGLGSAMLLLLLGLRLVATQGLLAPATLACLVGALLVGTGWVRWELRASAPAVDVRVLASRRIGPIDVAGFLFGLVMFGSQTPLTTFVATDPALGLGYGFAASPGRVSALVAVLAILATLGAVTFHAIATRVGIRVTLFLGPAGPHWRASCSPSCTTPGGRSGRHRC
jgi:MFS family permease